MVVAELILGSPSAALVHWGFVQLLLESEGLGLGSGADHCCHVAGYWQGHRGLQNEAGI